MIGSLVLIQAVLALATTPPIPLDGVLVEAPASIDWKCPDPPAGRDPRAPCEDTISFIVTNLRRQPIRVVRVRFGPSSGVGVDRAMSQRVKPGATWQDTLPVLGPGTYQLALWVTTGGVHRAVLQREVTVHTPAYDAKLAACEACHGTWGPQGMLGVEQCVCPLPDANKPCDDSTQCQGDCYYRETVVVTPERTVCPGAAPNATGARAEPCHVEPQRSKYVGVCQATDAPYGCKTTIPDGMAATYPFVGDGPALRTICTD